MEENRDHYQAAIEAYIEKRFQKGDHEAALDLLERHHIITHPITGKIHVFADGHYRDDGDVRLKNELTKTFGTIMNRTRVSEIMAKVSILSWKPLDKLLETTPATLIPFQGKVPSALFVLDITSMREKQTMKQPPFFTYKHPVRYNPDATCPNIDAFIESVVLPEHTQLLYDIAGLCLSRERLTRHFFILVGDGHNGKSIYLSILRALLGEERCVSITPQSLSDRQFTPVLLYDRHANLGADIPGGYIKDASLIKSVTGGDLITVEKKGKDHFEVKPYAELIYSSNDPPRFAEDTTALWDRLVVIPFPHTFVPHPTKPNERKEDHDILLKCTTPEELSGFANRAIDCLRRIRETHRVSVESSTQATRDAYTRLTNTPVTFLQERCEQQMYVPTAFGEPSSGWVSCAELYAAYTEWCKEKHVKIESPRVFGLRLFASQEIIVEEGRETMGDTRIHSYRNIVLKPKGVTGLDAMSPLTPYTGLNIENVKYSIGNKQDTPSKLSTSLDERTLPLFLAWLNRQKSPVPHELILREWPGAIPELSRLKQNGEVYEPRPGTWAVLQ